MNLLTFLSQYWWLVVPIVVVLIAILVLESLESSQTKFAMTCDEAILKVNDHGFVWVDTRPVALYKQSSILGAKHISELKPIKVKSNKKPKYLYFCQQGSTSMKLAQKDNQHYLKGGFDAWLSQHLPVKKEE